MIVMPDLDEVLRIAARQLGTTVDAIRRLPNLPLVESAVAAPHASFAGTEAYPALEEKIAVLGWHLARNHGLPDANKRVAFLAMIYAARLNDRVLAADDPDDNDKVIRAVAAGDMPVEQFTGWIAARLR